ncbi:coproporphyrinogen III oxidase family protein [Slackia sp.]|uniref:coproporphyrinogen III oxidase family protein n=1 Tax=Slackia sp. TaxID=2049041 RepID=UPI00262D9D5D|nr:coproporphyrinogen III oxidase family protein [Slackia sp.]
MLSERMLTSIVKSMTKKHLALNITNDSTMPEAKPNQPYMLYMHVPFCERLCPYCSFNRYPFKEEVAAPYFENMRKEMLMLKDLGYDFESIYVGGGTPTIMIDELCETLDLARENFNIKEVSSETNPNHLTKPYLDKLKGRVQRLSVGVQSFDNRLLKQMDRYEKYGSGEEIFERIGEASSYFDDFNVDMIFNFPSQTQDSLLNDIETIKACACDQVTFSPLYVSSATTRKMSSTLGKVDYDREYTFYNIIDEQLTGGADPQFDRRTLWTFNRVGSSAKPCGCGNNVEVDEYAVSYEEYPAIGSGSISHLDGCLYVNNFSIADYNKAVSSGSMSIMGKTKLGKHDLMRYRFLLQLYDLRLDKKQFERDFGCTVERGLPAEMSYMRLNKAFATDDENELTLTPKGRYLTLVMYRQFLSGMNNLRDQARAALTGPERELLFGDGTPE